MNKLSNQNKQWACYECPLNQGDTCGPFLEAHESFPRMRSFHNGHDGWKEFEENVVIEKATNDVNPFQNGIDYVCAFFSKVEDKQKSVETKYGTDIAQIETYCNKIVKDDKKLVSKLLRVCFSAYTKNPLNLAIMAPTSEGKTYAAVQITNLLPKSDVIFVGKMSPTALIHQNGILVDSDGDDITEKLKELEESVQTKADKEAKQKMSRLIKDAKNLVDLSNKILVFAEPPHHELWDVLKPIMSHDRNEIEYKTTRGDGSLAVKETIIRGFPAVILCTAKNEKMNQVWDEMETRFDLASPNTSIQKYHQANQFTALKHGMPSIARDVIANDDEIKCTKHNIHRIRDQIIDYHKNMERPIANPFHKIIGDSFPSNEGISMRNCERFCTYCDVETMINADKNCKIQFKDKAGVLGKILISSFSDVSTAIDMMGEISTVPPEKMRFLKDVFEPCVGATLDARVTTKDLVQKYTEVTGKPITSKKMLDNYLDPLASDYGILEASRSDQDGRANLWKYSSRPNVNSLDFIRERIIEQSNSDSSLVKIRIDEVIEYSKNNVELDYVLDPQGKPIAIGEIQSKITPQKSNNSGVNQEQKQEQPTLSESSKASS